MNLSKPYRDLVQPLFALLSILVLFSGCDNRPSTADLILINGNILTVDDSIPNAQAIAIRKDRIIAVGSNEDIQRLVNSDTKVINLNGKLVIPGFTDGHAHLIGIGLKKARLEFEETTNWNEVVEMVKAAANEAEPGEWILGRGWHQEKWNQVPKPNIDGFPFHHSLSEVSPNNPVHIRHASGHASFANAKAMALAGILNVTENPAGGEIVRDKRGDAIGLFRENAQSLINSAYKSYLEKRTSEQVLSDRRKVIEIAMKECLSKGITSFHDGGSSFEEIDQLKKMAEQGDLIVRLWVMIGEDLEDLMPKLPDYRFIGLGDNFLTVRAIKEYMDGALGSHGAWLLKPYADIPDESGFNLTPLDEIAEAAELAIKHGFQFCTHAIGDRGVRETLDIYEQTSKAHSDKTDLRWRIEHSQHISNDDIPRFSQMGITAAMQGIHCTSDGPWVPKRIGNERARDGAYIWSTLFDSGTVVINGTDSPVEDVSPLANFYASVTRKLIDGSRFYPGQSMTRFQALRSMTINCAYAAFEEDIKGSITVGKLADFTILSNDIMTIPEEEIRNTKIVYTIVGGKIMYESGIN